jgi:hypothetical protein
MSEEQNDNRTVELSDGRKVTIDLSKITRRKSLQLVIDGRRATNVGARIDALAINAELSPDEFDEKMDALEQQFMEWNEKIMREQAVIFGLTLKELLDMPQSDYDLLIAKKDELGNDPVGTDPS